MGQTESQSYNKKNINKNTERTRDIDECIIDMFAD